MRFEPGPCSYNLVPYVPDYYSVLPCNSPRSIKVITKSVSHLTRLPSVIVAFFVIQCDQCTIKMTLSFPVMGICHCESMISHIIVKCTASHDNFFSRFWMDSKRCSENSEPVSQYPKCISTHLLPRLNP